MIQSSLWIRFRRARAFVFSLCALLGLACASIYSILLLREWTLYTSVTRASVIVLVAVHALGALILYLMLVIRFRVWLDAARISCILLFQLGASIFITMFGASFPCENLGTHATCEVVTLSVTIASWVLSGLLLVYAMALAAMSSVPSQSSLEASAAAPQGRYGHPRRFSTSSIDSKTSLLPPGSRSMPKHPSFGSVYSQASMTRDRSMPPNAMPKLSARSPYHNDNHFENTSLSLNNQRGLLRPPGTGPPSVYSAPSSAASSPTQSVPPSPYSQPRPMLSAVPPRLLSSGRPDRLPPRQLPNPFTTPMSRNGSVSSDSSSSSEDSSSMSSQRVRHPGLPRPEGAVSSTVRTRELGDSSPTSGYAQGAPSEDAVSRINDAGRQESPVGRPRNRPPPSSLAHWESVRSSTAIQSKVASPDAPSFRSMSASLDHGDSIVVAPTSPSQGPPASPASPASPTESPISPTSPASVMAHYHLPLSPLDTGDLKSRHESHYGGITSGSDGSVVVDSDPSARGPQIAGLPPWLHGRLEAPQIPVKGKKVRG